MFRIQVLFPQMFVKSDSQVWSVVDGENEPVLLNESFPPLHPDIRNDATPQTDETDSFYFESNGKLIRSLTYILLFNIKGNFVQKKVN